MSPAAPPALLRTSPHEAPRWLAWPEGQTLAEIVAAAPLAPHQRARLVVLVGDAQVPQALWGRVRPKAGALVSLAVRPAGGDSGEKVLRTLLQVAVIALSAFTGGLVGGLAGTLLAAGLTLAGNALINALLPPARAAAGEQVQASYSVDGARNEARPWQPVPLPLGDVRVFPPLMAAPVQEIVGDDVYLRLAVCWGPGPIALSDLKIGETPVENFQGVEIEHRLTPAAPAHLLYQGDVAQEAVGAVLGTGWTTRVTQADCDEIACIQVFPQGLGGFSGSNRTAASVTLEIQWRPAGSSGTWRAVFPGNSEAQHAGRDPDFSAQDLAEMDAEVLRFVSALPSGTVSGAQTVTRAAPGRAVRHVIRWLVPRGQYEVRVRRTNAQSTSTDLVDQVQWAALESRARARDPFPERTLATSVLRIRASDQLSGVIDTLNGRVTRLAPTLAPARQGEEQAASVVAGDWQTLAATRNPADLALFFVRGAHAARPVADSEIDWPGFALWRARCVSEGFSFDLDLRERATRQDVLDMIGAAGRARIRRVHGRLTPVMDWPRVAPVQLMTPRNLRGLQVTRVFPPRTQGWRVRFANRARGFRQDERLVPAPGYEAAVAAGTAVEIETVDAPGITDAAHVWKWARHQLASLHLQLRRAECEQDIEHLAAGFGALVQCAHWVLPGVGFQARVQARVSDGAGDIIGLVLDEPVEVTAAARGPSAAWVARWRRVLDNGGDGALDAETVLALQDQTQASAQIMLALPLAPAAAPAPGDLLAIGPADRESRAMLVAGIAPGEDLTARVFLVDYAPERYGLSASPPAFVSLLGDDGGPPPAPVLGASLASQAGIDTPFEPGRDIAGGLVEVDRFEARWRDTPPPGVAAEYGPWEVLAPSVRLWRAPLPRPPVTRDIELVAVDALGQRSPAASRSAIAGLPIEADSVSWGGVTSRPPNLAALAGSEAILNAAISVDGAGLLQGIGTGAGTAVRNDLLVPSITAGVLAAGWWPDPAFVDPASAGGGWTLAGGAGGLKSPATLNSVRYFTGQRRPFDRTQRYTVALTVTGAQTIYVGLRFYDAAGALITTTTGATGWAGSGSSNWYFVSNVSNAGTVEYRRTLGPGGAVAPEGAASAELVLLANYNPGLPAVEMLFQGLRIEPMPEITQGVVASGAIVPASGLVTAQGTAAAITGQGQLATLNAAAWGAHITGRPANVAALAGTEDIQNTLLVPSITSAGQTSLWSGVSGAGKPADNATVGARAGTNLYRTDGTTVLTQAEVRTAEGTAAAITGQGQLATLNAAAWGAHITGRPANVAALTGAEDIQNTLLVPSITAGVLAAGWWPDPAFVDPASAGGGWTLAGGAGGIKSPATLNSVRYFTGQRRPFDRAARYTVALTVTGTQRIYAGLRFYDAAGALITTTTGATGWGGSGSSNWYFVGATSNSGTVEYRRTLGPGGAVAPEGAVSAELVLLANYNSGLPAVEMLFQGLRIEPMPEITQGVVASGAIVPASGLVTAQGTAAAITGQGQLATLNAAAWGTHITGRPANVAALAGSEAILNTAISVDGAGLLQGIGTGAGTAVRNDLLVPSITSAAQTAAWGSVAGRPTDLAGLDSSAGTKLAGIEAGADVTATATPSLYLSLPALTIACDWQGNVFDGQLPRVLYAVRQRGNADVSATTTWSIVDAIGCAASVSAAGVVTLSACTASGRFTVRSLRDGVTLDSTVLVTRQLASPPQTGSGGGTTVQDTSFNAVSGTSAVTVSDEMTVRTGAGGQIALTASLACTPASPWAAAANFPVAARWQYKLASDSTWLDAGAGEVESDPDALIVEDTEFSPPEYYPEAGQIAIALTLTGLSAATDYSVRLRARRTTSSPSKSIALTGTASAVGS